MIDNKIQFIRCNVCDNPTINIYSVKCYKCNKYLCDFCMSIHNLNYVDRNITPDCMVCFLK